MKENIVIVGGGTAGWLTALYAKKVFPSDNVILIESEEIGILGAGEGSTGILISLLDFLQIPVSELIKNTHSTIKTGIKFSNWSVSKPHFYNPFLLSGVNNFQLESSQSYSHFDFLEHGGVEYSYFYSALNNHDTKDFVFAEKCSENNLVPFEQTQYSLMTRITNPIKEFKVLAGYSIHFDANVLAKFLRQIAEQRGIIRKEGIVEQIITDDDGYIQKLKTNNDMIESTFVFDCTGFRRVIIGNFYKSEWKSHAEHLPAKKAVPFFLDRDDQIPPYTEAIAMKYGWVWKIPLQHRYGCGYVFDSDFISDDDAKKEIDDMLGFEVNSPRTFNFNAGCYKEVWIKNCLAIGLASGFIEPLEATSIYQSILTLKKFFQDKTNIKNKSDLLRKKVNNEYLKETQEIVDFIYLHYVTKRTDTEFWKNFTINNKMPEFIRYILEISKQKPLSDTFDFNGHTSFNTVSYTSVLYGNDLLSKKDLADLSGHLIFNKNEEYFNMLRNQNISLQRCVSHNEFINLMKNY